MGNEHFEWNTVVMPRYLAAGIGGVAAVAMLVASFIAEDKLTIWLISASFLLLFSLSNHIQSILVDNYKKYTIEGVYTFMITFIVLGGLSVLLSGISIFDAGSYRTIYIVILVSFFFFMGIIMLIKSVLLFLDHKDKKLGKK